MEALESGVLQLSGVATCLHRFGGMGFSYDGKEFAHLHGNGLLDVHLTKDRAAALVAAGRAEPHHVFGHSAWISFWMHSQEDVSAALTLIEEGVQTIHAKEAPSIGIGVM